MKKIVYIVLSVFVLFTTNGWAQQITIKSKVLSTDNTPVEGAIVTLQGQPISVISDSVGDFSLSVPEAKGALRINAEGFYEMVYPLNTKVIPSKIVLIPQTALQYSGVANFPFEEQRRDNKLVSTVGVEKKDMRKVLSVDLAVQDEASGLQVIKKSGMPGEGGYMNLRGIHSLVADNAPLLVINGVPYMGNQNVSDVITGYSRDLLYAYNRNDIRSITVLKGSDAAMYGSLASNGVLLIETEQATSDNMETRISFSGQYGLNFVKNNLPVLGVSDYKSYLKDIGLTRYGSMASLTADYPFLQNGTNYYSYLFNNNTTWIDEVQRTSFVSDNVFRVEGGDEIAKYNISFGYTTEGGTVDNTNSDRYQTLINSNIMVSRKFDIFTNVSLAYIASNLQEQGMVTETNPLLTSYLSMPMLSPYQKEDNGNILQHYATYNGWNTNSNPSYAYDNVSNPLAIVSTVEAKDKIYDANIRFGLNYRPNDYLTFTGLLNIYYAYTEESAFIPGVTDKAIVPQLYGTGENVVRKSVVKQKSNYYELNARYHRVFDKVHDVNGYAAIRYLDKDFEYDITSGYNTANDYYQTLGNVVDERYIWGNNDEWKWLSYVLHADYTYNSLLKTTANLSVDGSSVSGVDASRYGFFPSLGLTFMAANTGILPTFVDLFNISVEGSMSGNARFSSNYGKNYYQNSNFFNLGTIIRSNVPNTKLEWEKKKQLDAGVDIALFKHKVNLQVNYYNSLSYDLLLARTISSVYGSPAYYDNTAEITNQGWEAALRLTPVQTEDFEWTLSGNIAFPISKVKSLGSQNEATLSFTDYNEDDAMVILRKDESPYQFYGYQTNGVYATTKEVADAGLTNIYGNGYEAGDVRFVDQNNDGIINDDDKVLLGSATPDFFGSISTVVRYKQFTLQADFGYSVGNKAYNATRRMLESMSNFNNQSTAVLNRWQVEGQITDMPRATYGDPSGNNFFSDRWIEDASYIKLRSVMLTYSFDNSLFRFVRSGSLYVVAENLFTLTDYLGSDPEFSYSYNESMRGFDYAKTTLPVCVKVGVNLNF